MQSKQKLNLIISSRDFKTIKRERSEPQERTPLRLVLAQLHIPLGCVVGTHYTP